MRSWWVCLFLLLGDHRSSMWLNSLEWEVSTLNSSVPREGLREVQLAVERSERRTRSTTKKRTQRTSCNCWRCFSCATANKCWKSTSCTGVDSWWPGCVSCETSSEAVNNGLIEPSTNRWRATKKQSYFGSGKRTGPASSEDVCWDDTWWSWSIVLVK